MKKSEKTLLFITIGIAVLSLSYIYLLEPAIKSIFTSNSVELRNKKYIDILNRKQEIQKQAARIFTADYWKKTAPEQQIAFQMQIENLAKKSGIIQIKSIYPLNTKIEVPGQNYEKIALQLEIECSVDALSKLLYNIGTSDVPMQVGKLQIFSETGDPNIIRIQIEVASIFLLPE